MLLRTQIIWMLATLMALLLAAMTGLYYSQLLLIRYADDAGAVKALSHDISDLRFALTETVLYREQRAAQLWQRKLNQMRKGSLTFHFSVDEQNELKASILRETATAASLYQELRRVPPSAAAIKASSDQERELTARLVAALLVSTQEMLDAATEIGRLNEQQVASLLLRRQQYSVGALAALAIFALSFAHLLRNKVLRPLEQFEQSANVVGGGDLRHRISLYSRNELGKLAQAFNDMTQRLQQTVEALHSKIAAYDAVQAELRDHATQLSDDIAERKLVETALQQARKEAEMANRAKDAFIASMSHELRTPLNAVLGSAQLLDSPELNVDQRQYLGLIHAAGASLLAKLNDILDYSTMEAGGLVLESVPFALGPVLDAVAASMSANMGTKDLELVIGVAPVVPSLLTGDALRLQQVLQQLTGNAIKFTEQGEVRLHISVYTDGGTDNLLFTVSDTGIGIAACNLPHMFNPFQQIDSGNTRRYGGSGLGLVISQRLAQMMGGSLQVQSQAGCGSVFSLALPLGAPIPTLADRAVLTARRLLLVDPHQSSLAMLSLSFSATGWRADACDSSSVAVERLRQAKAPYDLLLASADLPQRALLEQAQADFPCALRRPVVWLGRRVAHDGASNLPVLLKPVTVGAVDTLLAKAPSVSPGGTGVAAPLRVLLVEDNPMNQFVASRMLEQLGATAVVAEDGAQALAQLQADVQAFDLVLMDIHMPVMDGFEATRQIRNQLGLTLPIVALTAGVTEYERELCFSAGMDQFLSKPVTLERLGNILRQHRQLRSAVLPAPAAPAQRQEVLDIAPLVALCAERPAQRTMLRDMVADLVRKASIELDVATQQWHRAETAQARRTLHGMRGAFAAIGAHVFAAAAHQLEQALQEDRHGDIHALFSATELALAEALAAAQRWLEAQDPEPVAADTNLAPDALRHWIAMLASQDMAASEMYIELRPALRRLLSASDADHVESAMHRFDFPTILACLQAQGEFLADASIDKAAS